MFARVMPAVADLTGKAVIEQTISVLILAQGILMAVSGGLGVLRTCRYLVYVVAGSRRDDILVESPCIYGQNQHLQVEYLR
jgi:hypothetical protein